MKRSKTLRRATAAIAVIALAVMGLAAGVTVGAQSAPVVVGGRSPESPAISGDRVVWADEHYGSFDIYLYDASSGVTTRLTNSTVDEIDPDVSGDTVVYAGYGAKGFDIYAYDIPSRTTRAITAATGDQMVPQISGAHVVWEDRYPSYTAQIWGVDLDGGTPFKIDSGYGIGKRRPRVSGDVVVYEDYPRGVAADSDVLAMTFPPDQFANLKGVKTRIAGTLAPEIVPEVDGRYVVWADGSGEDMDIRAYDLNTAQAFWIRQQPGAQTAPVVDGTTVYWSDNGADSRLHTDTYDIASNEYALFDSYSAKEPASLSVGDGGVVWLEGLRDSWRVRALPGPFVADMRLSASALLPMSPAWLPFRLAQVSTAGDTVAPMIERTSVEPGAVMVDNGARLVATASEPLDARSVSGRTVSLVDAAGNRVKAKVRYSALSRSIEIVPAKPLGEGTYLLSIGPGLKDKKGNASSRATQVAFSTIGVLADVAIPTVPSYPAARVSGLASVEVSWTASSDDVAVAGYEVYRHSAPISAANLGSATLVANVTAPTTSVTTPTAAGETAGKYTLYYAVRAYDTSAKFSNLSANTSPDPHGTYVAGANTRNCELCHSVHGAGYPASWRALGAQSADACYLCHGGTAMATAYGYGSTLNTQARFWDYDADPLPSTGSQHRNAYMDSEQLQCASCHTAHKKPYDADSTKSYTKMLRRYEPSLGYWVYWRSDGTVVKSDGTPVAATFDKALCLSCHGLDTTDITRVGGGTAYANSAGDHSTGYDTAAAAHGPSTVRDDPLKATTVGPQVPCTACHNKHASASANLIDYRTSNTAIAEYDQSGLCFECHVDNYVAEYNGGTNWKSNSANAYFAWNGRNVATEFARASHHPTGTAGPAGSLVCYSCHNTHYVQKGTAGAVWQAGRVSDPDNTKTVWAGTTTAFCIKCHDAAAPTKNVTDPNTLVPYDVGFSSVTNPFFPEWNKSGYTAAGHGTSRVDRMTVGCESCHDPHGSDNKRLTALTAYYVGATPPSGHVDAKRDNTATYAEEKLCLVCHLAGTGTCVAAGCHTDLTNPNAAGDVTLNVETPFAQTYRHDVANASWTGRHSDTETASGLGAANRHVECADCHDPHLTKPGRHVKGSSVAGAVLTGAIGVKPTSWPTVWTAVSSSGYTTERMSGESTDYEAYVCLKCHSSYTTRGTTSGGFASTDVALEFNPNNAGGHNVFGSNWSKNFSKGGFTWTAASPVFVGGSGWTATSAMTCSDCHSYQTTGASGPHGSSVRYILKYGSATDDWWATDVDDWTTDPGNMCAACHTNSHNAWLNDRAAHRVVCEKCHIRIPHGWKRPRLLVYQGTGADADSAPYRATTGVTGLIGVDLKDFTDGPSVQADCQTDCGTHSSTPVANQW